VAFLGWRMIRGIVRPVAAMHTALVAADGRRDLTTRVAVHGNDELAQMGGAFNALMAGLQETLKRVVDGAREVSSAASLVATTSTQISRGAQSQSDSASSTAAAVQEVTVSIGQVADHTRETRGVSEQARELAVAGEASARAAAEQMQSTAQSVAESMALVERLAQRSGEISGIVAVIREVAEQTNLLALNAAIEAARAGEQGRGFAVVADEVRKLAERTSSSTGQISGMIEAIQTDVAGAVMTLKANNAQVSVGKSLAEDVATTLARINDGVRTTMERINDISAAVSEQSAASNGIAANVERIAQMSEETSAAIAQASVTSQQLEAVATRLNDDVSQFSI
jgi:methyl-accepting chemotaxis protein